MKSGQTGWGRFQRMNRPPPDEAWVWLTREMLKSPAWQALPDAALRVLLRVMVEHASHAGCDNGELICTYDDFERYGVRRKSIFGAIEAAVTLGFLDVTARGQRAHGIARRPSKYGLTWLPRHDGTPHSNRWKRFETVEQAIAALKAGQAERSHRAGSSKRAAPAPRAASLHP